MKTRQIQILVAITAALCSTSPIAIAQSKPAMAEKPAMQKDLAGEQEADEPTAKFEPGYWASEAARILDEQMSQELDKRIPEALLSKAKCAAVFPQLVQVGVGIGAKTGSGMVSCRQPTGEWGAPLFIDVTGLSFGLQAGVKSTEAVLLAMTDNGLDQLFAGKPVAEGELGVTAGPVGRAGQVGLDVLLKTPLLSYTRSKGLFVGAIVGGSVMASRRDANLELYGDYQKPRDILFGKRAVPAAVGVMPEKLDEFAPAKN